MSSELKTKSKLGFSMQSKLCAICGIEPACSDDHIPPKGIYPKPRDNDANLKTVPACSNCNNGASPEDEEFKVFICFSTGEFRQNADSVINSMAGTIEKNNKIAHQIFSTKTDVYTFLQGPIAEPAVAVEFNAKKICDVFERIVRGLYWIEKGAALGLAPVIRVFPFYSMNAEFQRSMKELMDCLTPKSLNKGTFIYKVYFREDGSSIWGMQFFNVPQTTTFAYAAAPST